MNTDIVVYNLKILKFKYGNLFNFPIYKFKLINLTQLSFKILSYGFDNGIDLLIVPAFLRLRNWSFHTHATMIFAFLFHFPQHFSIDIHLKLIFIYLHLEIFAYLFKFITLRKIKKEYTDITFYTAFCALS